MKVNLGCSDRLRAGYVNVDLHFPKAPTTGYQFVSGDDGRMCLKWDLTLRPWPFKDGEVEEIIADDIIEHLPDKIQTMNEIWRVLQPGGIVKIFVPTTDGRGAWQDPTHVSYWNRNSFLYWTKGDPHYTRFKSAYGMQGCFEVVEEETKVWPVEVVKLKIVLRKVED